MYQCDVTSCAHCYLNYFYFTLCVFTGLLSLKFHTLLGNFHHILFTSLDRATEVAVASVALVDTIASLDSLRRLSVVLSAVSRYPPTHLMISNNTNVEHLLRGSLTFKLAVLVIFGNFNCY